MAATAGVSAAVGAKPPSVSPRSIPSHRAGSTTDDAANVVDVRLPISPAVVAENAKEGTAWWVTTPQVAGGIEGYADHVSAVVGDSVTFFVNTTSPTFHVEAYRLGWYHGIGGRLVWQSIEVPGVRQAPPVLVAPMNMIQCQWTPSITVKIDPTWPPGAYLMKLVGTQGQQGFVPLCIRDDASQAALVIQQGVASWQAYNRWGGYSLYYGNKDGALTYTHGAAGATYADRARVVSFDRPYDHDWASGAADVVGNELPVIFDAERLGLDVTYWTDLDLHAHPERLAAHRGLLTLGHDEYWSAPMRNSVETAVQNGLNVAFLGANACFRQIRIQPSPLGPDRQIVCFKSAKDDPMTGVDPSLVTVNWDQPPVNNSEAQLTGAGYQDVDAEADMVIADGHHWLLAGTGVTTGQHLPGVVAGEFDRYVPGGAAPNNVDVIAHSPIPNRNGNHSDVTWYTATAGGGVFDSGNASWVGKLSNAQLIPPNVLPSPVPGATPVLLRIMRNLYAALGNGPASITHPSTGTWRAVYRG